MMHAWQIPKGLNRHASFLSWRITMTITFQKPTGTLCLESIDGVSLRRAVWPMVETTEADPAKSVPRQTRRSQALVLSQNSSTEFFPDLKARLDVSFPRLALSRDAGQAPLHRDGRTFQ